MNIQQSWFYGKVKFYWRERVLYLNHLTVFFYQGFLSQTLTIHKAAGEQGLTIHRAAREGRGPSFWFHYTTSTRSLIFKHIFATLWDVRWEMWDDCFWSQRLCLPDCCSMRFTTLSNYHLIDWLIDWWCNVCLFAWWIDSRFLLQQFDMGNWWIWTRIDYHPYVSSKLTNQVC